MKKFYGVMNALCSILLISQASMAHNPVISQKYTADPNAIVYNDRVYVYCSHDDNNRDNGFNIFDYTLVSSDDMVNWTDHGEVFVVPRDAKWASQAYAPGAAVKGDKVYLYIPDGGSKIGVAVADRPEGPFTDPINKALITKSMPNCNVEWLFDPACFVDDDGQAYLYFGGGQNTPGDNLRVIKLNEDMISVDGTAKTILAPRSFEAAFMHKYNELYFFSYSNDFAQSPQAQIAYMTGSSPMGPFDHKGSVLDNPAIDGQNINKGNNNHASIVEYKDKWYIFYHDRRLSDQTYKRSVSVDLVTYNDDGTLMNKTECTTDGPPQIKNFNPYDTVQAETIYKQSGIKTDICNEGGIMVTKISADDFISLKGVDFSTGADKFEVRAASASSGGSIELHRGSKTGTLVGTCEITGTGGWNSWQTFSCDVENCSGVDDLYLVFKGSDEPFRLNWYMFFGSTGTTGTTGTTGSPFSVKTTESGIVSQTINGVILEFDTDGPLFSETVKKRTVVKLFNLKGEIVKSSIPNGSNSLKMDLSDEENGFYIIKVVSGGRIVHSSKMVITR